MRRRLAEVARKVGVSEATVSRVLNEQARRVSERPARPCSPRSTCSATSDRRKLRGERARLVGLVLPELQNPIFPAFAEVVGGALAQNGLHAGAVHPDRRRHHRGRLRRAAARPAGVGRGLRRRPLRPGATPTTTTTRRLAERNLPTVLVNAADRRPRVPAGVVRRRHGHRAGVRPPRAARPRTHRPPARARRPRAVAAQAGRRRCSPQRAHGIELADELVVHGAVLARGRPGRGDRLLRDRRHRASSAPATRSRSARSAPCAAPACTCPSDVSVVGYDDSALMNCTEPPLTTVRQPIEPMGRTAIELPGQPDRRRPRRADELLFEPELVVRGSTGAGLTARAPRRRLATARQSGFRIIRQVRRDCSSACAFDPTRSTSLVAVG